MSTIPCSGLSVAADGRSYCFWRAEQPEYQSYHDHEWGRPVQDDQRLFEKICLEGFQSGLAWITILRKRAQFRVAFDDFDFSKVAHYTERDVARLLADRGIVRNRAKIMSTINNARRACELRQETGSLAAWLWQFAPAAGSRAVLHKHDDWLRNTTSEPALRLSQALKQRGWSFVGPTTMHAFMQAMGLINDHLSGCACRAEIEAQRQAVALLPPWLP